MPPSSRNQVQELLSVRRTPARLAHSTPTEEARGVADKMTARAGSSWGGEILHPDDTSRRRGCTTSETRRTNGPSSGKFQRHHVERW